MPTCIADLTSLMIPTKNCKNTVCCPEQQRIQHKCAIQICKAPTNLEEEGTGAHQPADLLQHLRICHLAVRPRVVALPQEAVPLPLARTHVTVQAVVREVGAASFEAGGAHFALCHVEVVPEVVLAPLWCAATLVSCSATYYRPEHLYLCQNNGAPAARLGQPVCERHIMSAGCLLMI